MVGSTARLSRRREPCELGPLSLEAAGTTGSPAYATTTLGFMRVPVAKRVKVWWMGEPGSAYARSINSTLY